MTTEDKKGQVEGILTELGKKIDILIHEAKDAKDDIRDDLEEKIKELKDKKETLEDDFNEYKDKGKDKWDEAKPHFTSAFNELKLAMDKLFGNK